MVSTCSKPTSVTYNKNINTHKTSDVCSDYYFTPVLLK